MDEFPANTQRAKPVAAPTEKASLKAEKPKVQVSRVVEGKVVRRKKPLSKRLKDMIVADDSVSVTEYVLQGVVIPYAKDMVADAATEFIERLVFGESRGIRRTAGRGPNVVRGPLNSQHVPYNRYGGQGNVVGRAAGRGEDPRQMSRQARATHNFDEIVLDSAHEAEEVLAQMFAMLHQYEQVTIANLYDLLGVSSNFTDDKYGWIDLRGSSISRVRGGGFVLNLPRPEPLD